jgi:hypothetical protein
MACVVEKGIRDFAEVGASMSEAGQKNVACGFT